MTQQFPRTNVIILTYMRSGSTLTGEMFSQHPDVFYVFEPMHTLKWIWWSQKTRLNFFDRPSRMIKSAEDFARAARDIASGFLRCHPTKIDVATLSQFHLGSSNDTKPYHVCLKKNPGVLKILDCLPILQKQCMESDVSVIKTIRFPMEAVETMMKSNPSLKVIHLIRDPRPTIKSQMSMGRDKWSNLHSYSKEHCLRVLRDLQATQRLLKSHPNRTKLLLYEDLVVHPVQNVKDLYSFVGLTYTNETERFLLSRTNSSEEKHCTTCTQKSNSTLMTLRWRKELDFNRAHVIDGNCKDVYQMLGYLPVNTASELVDMSKSLKNDRKL
ncbi:carbohydrate sulfotransferase 1-like [Haliotis asinina]|uniref:carbohydrate sulfotransferase 1-like n=1 Tax=Haliotis asinina TaxID=109174 RepID=UPI0035327168